MSNNGPRWVSPLYTTDHQCFNEKHVLAALAAFFLALAASSFGWLGSLMYHRYIVSAVSGALIVCGYTLSSQCGIPSALLFGSMIHAFGIGSLFSTIPAYMSVSKTSFIQSVALMTLPPIGGGIAMQNLSNIILRSRYTNFNVGLHIILSLVLGSLPNILQRLDWSHRSQSDAELHETAAQELQHIDVCFKLNDGQTWTDGRIHPFEYSYKPGMELRPAPTRAESSSAWKPVRQRLLSPFMEVRDRPRRTELVRKLEDHLWQGDELMDAVIDLGHRIGLGVVRKMVMTALSHGIQALQDPPTEIIKLFEQLDSLPEWFNADEFENGRVMFSNASWFGPIGLVILNKTITAQAESVASAVGATGQFTSGTTKTQMRRHLETTHFFARVPRPGGWKRFSETFQETVKVRFMHCQARYLLKKRWGPEHFDRHGMPISSSDMAYGIVTFGVMRLICDGVFGIKHSTEDLDSVVRFWGYIGYIFGVPEEIIPRNFEEATQVLDYGLSSYGTPTPYTAEIVKSFDTFNRELLGVGRTPICRFLNKLNVQLVHGLTYFICGDVLGSRMVAGSRYSKGYLRILSLVSAVFTKFSLSIAALKEGLPGRTKRMEARAIKGDPFDDYVDGLSANLMKRYGLRPTFDAHDNHSVNDFRQN